MYKLREFGLAIMDHVRNDTKTPIENVQSAFESWKRVEEDKASALQEKRDKYMTDHHQPRIEREQEYNTYLQTKTMMYGEYQNPSLSATQKQQKLLQYLKVPIPESLEEGVYTDLIYTLGRD